jgi:hypothetical protein
MVTIIKIWAFTCWFKLISIHNILKYSNRWIAIIKSFQQIVPMLYELLWIYFIGLLIFANFGVCMYGGLITSEIGKAYEAAVLDNMDRNLEQ